MFVTALQIPWAWSISTLAVGPDITVGDLFRALPGRYWPGWLLSSAALPIWRGLSTTFTITHDLVSSLHCPENTLQNDHTPFLLIIILTLAFAVVIGAVARLIHTTHPP